MKFLRGSKSRYLCLCCQIFFLIIILQGCFSIAKHIDADKVAKIEIGKTTKNDVLGMLGLPNKRELKTIQEGKQLEFWIYYKGPGERTYFLPIGIEQKQVTREYVPVFGQFTSQEKKNIAVIFIFDEKGLLVDLEKGED